MCLLLSHCQNYAIPFHTPLLIFFYNCNQISFSVLTPQQQLNQNIMKFLKIRFCSRLVSQVSAELNQPLPLSGWPSLVFRQQLTVSYHLPETYHLISSVIFPWSGTPFGNDDIIISKQSTTLGKCSIYFQKI